MSLNRFTKKKLGITYSWFIPTINEIRVIQKCDLPTACLQRLRTAILTEPVRALIAHAPRLEIDERTAKCMRGTWTFKTTYRGVCCFLSLCSCVGKDMPRLFSLVKEYDDKLPLPNPRVLSVMVSQNKPYAHPVANLLMPYFAQLIGHDLTLSKTILLSQLIFALINQIICLTTCISIIYSWVRSMSLLLIHIENISRVKRWIWEFPCQKKLRWI